MGNITKDLLRRDECQPLTSEQIADIKAQTATRPKANVNIKPYEIMDLDGTEQVVGEVQKTIGGVKKKKPLYKKMVTGLNVSVSSNWTTICNIPNIENIFYGIMFYDNVGTTLANTCTYKEIEPYTNGDIKIQANVNRKINATLFQYTKTTDSWEDV